MSERKCVECGAGLPADAHHRLATCSDKCRAARRNRQVGAAVSRCRARARAGEPSKVAVKPTGRKRPACPNCGGRVPDDRHWSAKTCSKECGDDLRRRSTARSVREFRARRKAQEGVQAA